NKDVQELAEEAQQQVGPEEEEESGEFEDVNHDEYASSPIANEDVDITFQKLEDVAGKYGVGSTEGFKCIRRKAKQGSAKMMKLRE
ncbi:hypothetical protein BGZ51_001178, partial [Haplosporangium sp. Z 767]